MRPEQRVQLALEMSDDVMAITRAGIRHRHPDWPPTRVEAEIEVLLLRAEVATAAPTNHAG